MYVQSWLPNQGQIVVDSLQDERVIQTVEVNVPGCVHGAPCEVTYSLVNRLRRLLALLSPCAPSTAAESKNARMIRLAYMLLFRIGMKWGLEHINAV